MKAYSLLAYYQLKHNLKALMLFLILLLCLSWVLQSVFISNAHLVSVPIALVDDDNTPTSQRVVASILKKTILNTQVTTLSTANVLLKNHRVEAIVSIKQGFEKGLMTGKTEKLVDLIYLDRSTSAPALTDVLAGSVLKEACAYNAILQVQRYDDSDEALEEVTRKVRLSIDKQEYRVPLEATVKLPSHPKGISAPIPFEDQLPRRLAIGYGLFAAFLCSAFYAVQIAQDALSPSSKRLRSSPYPLWTSVLFFLGAGAVALTLIFGMLTFYFYGFANFKSIMVPLVMLAHFFSALLIWQGFILALALLTKARSSFNTLLMPLVILIGLLSGYFWPLDFISKNLLKPLKFLPTIQLLNQFENMLLGQSVTIIDPSVALISFCILLLSLLVTVRVTTLKK